MRSSGYGQGRGPATAAGGGRRAVPPRPPGRRRRRTGGSRVAGAPSARRGRRTRRRGPWPRRRRRPRRRRWWRTSRRGPGRDRPRRASTVTSRQPTPWTSSNQRPSRSPCGNSSPASGAPAATRPLAIRGQARRLADPAVVRRGHRLVARRGLGRVGDADHLAELDREVDRRAGARSALLVVGGQERRRGAPVEHEVELPRQVGRVAEAGAHALSGERRHLVRGVAGEEDPPDLPPRGDPRLERVDGVPLEAGVARVHVPRREQLPGPGLLVQVLDPFLGEAHELPAPAARSARHGGGRPRRVADLEVGRVEDPGLVEDHVDDEPVVEEAPVVDVDAEQGANGRVGAVAADDVPGADRACRAGLLDEPVVGSGLDRHVVDHDVVVVLLDAADADASPDVEPRAATRPAPGGAPRARAGRTSTRTASPTARLRRGRSGAASCPGRCATRRPPPAPRWRGPRRRCRTTGGCVRPRGRSAPPSGACTGWATARGRPPTGRAARAGCPGRGRPGRRRRWRRPRDRRTGGLGRAHAGRSGW